MFESILSASATILGALIGAVGTIIAALITKTYIDHGAKNIKDVVSPSPVRRNLLNIFSFFRVSNSLTFRVKNKSAVFRDKYTGLTIIPRSKYGEVVGFDYQLPHESTRHSVDQINVGWRELFEWDGIMYSLSLVRIVTDNIGRVNEIHFDFRPVDKNLRLLTSPPNRVST